MKRLWVASFLLLAACQPKVGLIPPLVQGSSCQEDDPCWNPATMGDHQGYICYEWFDRTVHAYHDTRDARGMRLESAVCLP